MNSVKTSDERLFDDIVSYSKFMDFKKSENSSKSSWKNFAKCAQNSVWEHKKQAPSLNEYFFFLLYILCITLPTDISWKKNVLKITTQSFSSLFNYKYLDSISEILKKNLKYYFILGNLWVVLFDAFICSNINNFRKRAKSSWKLGRMSYGFVFTGKVKMFWIIKKNFSIIWVYEMLAVHTYLITSLFCSFTYKSMHRSVLCIVHLNSFYQ